MNEESTSVPRQQDIILAWAKANDHEIIGWAIDLNVSGSVDPFDTPEFGKWLNERHYEWDIVAAWKLDRYSRRTIATHNLFKWCQDNSKTLVAISDSIDLSHWVGRLIASVLAGVAEGELEAIQERTQGSHRKLRELGRWAGGHCPYGFLPRQREDAAGWELIEDPDTAPILLEIIDKVLADTPMDTVARELTERGVLSPSDHRRQLAGKKVTGGPWRRQSIRSMLRSKQLLGHVTYDGATVYDPQGVPIKRGPELIPLEKFQELQEILQRRAGKPRRVTKASDLLHVAFCLDCDKPMHFRRISTGGKPYEYFWCPDKHGQGIDADILREMVEGEFLAQLGDEFVPEKIYIPGQDTTAKMNEALAAMDELTPLLATVNSQAARKRLTDQITALDARIVELEKTPTTESRYEFRPTSKTFRQVWEFSDAQERRELLIKYGITVKVKLTGRVRNAGAGDLRFKLHAPDDLKQRLS